MPGPTLTAQEIAQLEKEKKSATEAAATFTAQIAAQEARAAELGLVDSSFKKFFDYYDTDIIKKYDAERKAINGLQITSPIVEADILSCANLEGGRLQPSLPDTDVVRIAQFDGTPTTTDSANELQYITDQEPIETALVSGYAGTPPTGVLTSSAITAASTTLQLTHMTLTYNIPVNSVFVIKSGGGDLAVVKILSFVMQSVPTPPPFVANCNIELIVPPSGTIVAGKSLLQFTGFTNTERTNKTATVDADLQPLMDYLIDQLELKINSRLTVLNLQLAAIAANQDPEPGTELTTATTNVNTSKTFLTNYLVSTDISDTGLGTLSTERGSRATQAGARVTQINNAYTGRSLNYYDARYNFANNRANTARGSLRIQKNSESVAATSAGYADTLAAQASAISSILP